MDKQVVALFIPIMALAIPVIAVVMFGLQRIWKMRLEEARVRAGALEGDGLRELDALRGEVDQLRAELGDVQERLDFTERMLAQTRERQRLPDGAG